jgi:hypothetical protein
MAGSSETNTETTTLIEKLTHLITLQQSQLMALQQTSTTPHPPNPSEITIQPNIVPIKLDEKNYSL